MRCSDAAGKDRGLEWAACQRHSEHSGGSSRSLGDLREWCGAAVDPRLERGWGEPFPAAGPVGARGVSSAQAVLSVTGVH